MLGMDLNKLKNGFTPGSLMVASEHSFRAQMRWFGALEWHHP